MIPFANISNRKPSGLTGAPAADGEGDAQMQQLAKGGAAKKRLDKKSRSGIKIKKSHEGLLHKDLGVDTDKKIPEGKLEKAEKSSNPAVRKRATFAENAKHWKH